MSQIVLVLPGVDTDARQEDRQDDKMKGRNPPVFGVIINQR